MKASRVIGQPDFVTNTAGAGRARLNFDDGSGVAFDAAGNLWVGDSGNNRVLKFPNIGGTVRSFASVVLGQPDFDSTDFAITQNGMWIPVRPAFDIIGNIWVPDGNSARVLEYRAFAGSAVSAAAIKVSRSARPVPSQKQGRARMTNRDAGSERAHAGAAIRPN
jgi:hypothetical protein